MRIYVGNLSYDTTQDELRKAFEEFGEVSEVSLPVDRESGRPRGYGFLDMPVQEQAEAAIQAMNGKDVRGRALTVNEARPRTEGGGRDFGGGGFSGGGGGGRRNDRRY